MTYISGIFDKDKERRERLLIFGNSNLIFPPILLKEIYSFIRDHKDILLCGIVDTAKINPSPKLIRRIKTSVSELEKKIFNFEQKINFGAYKFNNLYDICSNLNIKVIIPPQRDINDQGFIRFLKESVKPTMGLSVGCLQIFKKDLINIFDILVNYHNGLLPGYGGLKTTSWSIYFSEKFTGFTFHHINEAIDAGNILIQDKIPTLDKYINSDLEYLKTKKASKYIGELLYKMIARDKGIAQGKQTYFGKKEYNALTKIENPNNLAFFEIEKRLFAFKKLKIKINNKYYPVTKISKYNSTSRIRTKMFFKTKDDVLVKLVRLSYLPVFLYEIRRSIKKFNQRWLAKLFKIIPRKIS